MERYVVREPRIVRGLAVGLAISAGFWAVLALSMVALTI